MQFEMEVTSNKTRRHMYEVAYIPLQQAEYKCLIVETFLRTILQNKFKYFLALIKSIGLQHLPRLFIG